MDEGGRRIDRAGVGRQELRGRAGEEGTWQELEVGAERLEVGGGPGRQQRRRRTHSSQNHSYEIFLQKYV